MAWDHVGSALDHRESVYELHANGGLQSWRGRLRRGFADYNHLANAVTRQLPAANAPHRPQRHPSRTDAATTSRRRPTSQTIGNTHDELRQSTREALKTVATSTLTGSLHKRGLRNMFLQDVQPLRIDQPRMVGIAFTMRFIPFREDMNAPEGPLKSVQPQAMEECPPGHVLVIDSRGDPRAASAGDLYIGRLPPVAAPASSPTAAFGTPKAC